MHPFRTLAATALLTAAPTIAAEPYRSWGRAGVSLTEYRTDAVACGRKGANADIAGEPAAKAVIAAQEWNDRNLNASSPVIDPIREQAQMVQRLRPEKRLAEVQEVHVTIAEQCLRDLGYTRFVLTRTQARALGRLGHGTPARHAFLHALASDPAVLAEQAVPPT